MPCHCCAAAQSKKKKKRKSSLNQKRLKLFCEVEKKLTETVSTDFSYFFLLYYIYRPTAVDCRTFIIED